MLPCRRPLLYAALRVLYVSPCRPLLHCQSFNGVAQGEGDGDVERVSADRS